MDHPLKCRCGTIKGHVIRPGMAKRIVCYCKDCQAFAHFLGDADTILDANGGTPILATLPTQFQLIQGRESLACMSLSGRGVFRWYASCCKTPIANTARDPRIAYVGLIGSCLGNASPSLDESFGPVRMVLNTKSAKGPVESRPLKNVVALLGLMKAVVGARLSGGYKANPFFDPQTGKPVVQARELTAAEREQVTP